MATIGNVAYVLRYKLAVARARRGGDRVRLAHKIRHLGDAYYYAGRPAAAEICYVEALSIYRRDQQTRPLDLANAIRSFAVLKHEGGATDEARQLWQEAHDLYEALKMPAGIAESAARLALLARYDGDLERSRECLTEARTAANATADPETLQYIREVTAQLGNSIDDTRGAR
jgi:tetratricopeptide (TPR) repeat protein